MSVAAARGDGGAMLRRWSRWRSMIVAARPAPLAPGRGLGAEVPREESGQTEAMSSWFLDLLRRSRILLRRRPRWSARARAGDRPRRAEAHPARRPRARAAVIAGARRGSRCSAALLAAARAGARSALARTSCGTSRSPTWRAIVAGRGRSRSGACCSPRRSGRSGPSRPASRSGCRPRLSRVLQPVVQVAGVLPGADALPGGRRGARARAGVGLGWGSVAPHAARHAVVRPVQRHRRRDGHPRRPARGRHASTASAAGSASARSTCRPSFPYLVTGWVTAAGGAWNASIVAEYVSFRGQILAAHGLGARISVAAAQRRLPVLAARGHRHAPSWWRLQPTGLAAPAPPRRAALLPRAVARPPCRSRRVPGRRARDPLRARATFARRSRQPRAARRCACSRTSTSPIRPNEVVALLGPSGCGKSTILRILAGLIAPTAGEVLYHGAPLAGLNPGVAFVFQSFALFPWMTVAENVEAVARGGAGSPRDEIAAQRRATPSGLVGLAGFEEAYPRELSGGMKQRVGMARRPLARPGDALHGRAVQPGGRAHGGEPARRGARHLGGEGHEPARRS